MTFKNSYALEKHLSEINFSRELEDGQQICISKTLQYDRDAGGYITTYYLTKSRKPNTSYRRYPSKYRR